MGVCTMKTSMMMTMMVAVMVFAGSASAEVWVFNVDYGPNPGGSAPFTGDDLYVGDGVFASSHLPGDAGYWNWRGAGDPHNYKSDLTH